MLQSLRREHPRSGVSTNSQLQGKAKETDTTAELDNHGLINLQQQIMSQQDTELDQLEQSVVTTKHVALQINEETTLHNRLLDELDGDVETTGNRLRVVQQKLKLIMGRSGSCKFYLLIGLLLLLLMLFIVLGFKLAVYFVKL